MLAQHDAQLLLLQLRLLLLLEVLQQLVLVGRLAARLQLASPEAMLHPVLLGRILGLRDGEEVLVPVGGPPAPNHGPGLTLNGEASLGARRQYNLCKCK